MTETVDSRLAGVVRRAWHRDVTRAVAALTDWPYPDPAQRAAIADHVSWMAKGVVPQPGAAATTVHEVASIAQRYRSDATRRTELAVALDGWADGVDWRLPEPATKAEAAATACWLSDDARADEQALIRSRYHTRASRPSTWIAQRAYRRNAYQRWYVSEHSTLKRHTNCHVSVEVAAPVEVVWQLVADPTRTPEWSHECHRVEFLDGATESGLGTRFAGGNRHGRTAWTRACTIFAFEECREFGYVTSSGQGDATAWHFRLEPTRAGTKLSQAYQIVAMPAWVSVMVGLLLPSHDDRADALRGDLTRLGALVE